MVLALIIAYYRFKGEYNDKERIKTINYVDYIILYDEEDIVKEDTLDKIMQLVNPYYWVKGSDYNIDDIKVKHPSLHNIYLSFPSKTKSVAYLQAPNDKNAARLVY